MYPQLSVGMFATIDPTAATLVHIVVSVSSTSNTHFSLGHRLGSRPKSQCIQLDLNSFTGCPKDKISNLYSSLLEGLVLHVWPAGLRPVLWIANDEMLEFHRYRSWTLLRHLLETVRAELTDETLDVVVKNVFSEVARDDVRQLCEDFKCTVCTSDIGAERMMLHLEGAVGPVTKQMTSRWSYGAWVESLPFYQKDAPW